MKSRLAIFFVAVAFSINAQTSINQFQALHPIMKDPNNRNAPTSLNQDTTGETDDMKPQRKHPPPGANNPAAKRAAPQIVKPAPVVAKIDGGLTAGKLTLVGTVKGLKGRIFVTNTGSHVVTPVAQFGVYDNRGVQIGTASAEGAAVAGGDVGKIEVLATNTDAVNMQLLKLAAR